MERPYKPCKKPGCPNLTRDASGYCPDHITGRDYRTENQNRDNSLKHIYNDPRYIKARIRRLSLNPLCQDCEEEGETTIATEAHHVKKVRDYPEFAFKVSNLRSLCNHHHTIRTNRGE